MTPTLRHAHRTALYQRRQLLRQTRREQQPVPGWFVGLGHLHYRNGQRPLPRPDVSLAQLMWQATQAGLRQSLRTGARLLWASRHVGLTSAVLGLVGLGIYGLVLLCPHFPSLAPVPPPALRPGTALPGEALLLNVYAAAVHVWVPLMAIAAVFLGGLGTVGILRISREVAMIFVTVGLLGLGVTWVASCMDLGLAW